MLLARVILHIMGVFGGFCICSPSFMEEIDILLLSFEGKRNWITLQIAWYFAQIHDQKTSLLQIALCCVLDTFSSSKSHLEVLKYSSHSFCLYFCPYACLPAYSVASVVSNSLQPYGPQPARLLCAWDSPGKNTRVGCQALLQGIFLTQRWKPASPESPALAGGFLPTSTTWEALMSLYVVVSIRGKTRSTALVHGGWSQFSL